jgi:RNA polymerase sigma-70 factor (ECF subfamily)
MDRIPDDGDLARRAREGDGEALATLVERWRLKLFALAYAELRHYEDAEDAVAAALLQVCRHVGELREPESVRAWMQSIVRNEARMRRRRRTGEPVGLPETEGASESAGDAWQRGQPAPTAELRLDIESALHRLPREEARAVALHYLGGLSIDEIARRVERPEGTIKRWLHGGRRRLATELQGYAPPLPAPSGALLCSDLEPAFARRLVDAMRAAGFGDVVLLKALPPLQATVRDEIREVRLAGALKGRQFIVLDEWIGGRSAFELHAMLKAAAEAPQLMFGLLLSAPRDETVFAGWCAGFQLVLAKEDLAPAEFEHFCTCVIEKLRSVPR